MKIELTFAIVFFVVALLHRADGVAAVVEAPASKSATGKAPLALAHKMNSLAGKEIDLAKKYQGKVVLVVNVASRCGLTPQYEQLQALHEKYEERGLAILGFPCNQFGKQEPGSADEITSFCEENYGVTFDMFAKIDVNGEKACELYKFLTKLKIEPKGPGKVSWNFEKFLVDRSGKVIARFEPRTKPNDPKLIALIESCLAETKLVK